MLWVKLVMCVCVCMFVCVYPCISNVFSEVWLEYWSPLCSYLFKCNLLKKFKGSPRNLLMENHYTYLTGLLWGKNKHVKEFLVYTRCAVYEKWVLLKPFSGLHCSLDKIQIPCPGMWTGSTLFLPACTDCLLDWYWTSYNSQNMPCFHCAFACLQHCFQPLTYPFILGSHQLCNST